MVKKRLMSGNIFIYNINVQIHTERAQGRREEEIRYGAGGCFGCKNYQRHPALREKGHTWLWGGVQGA